MKYLVSLSLVLALSSGACAGKRIPILVGNSAVAVADVIGQLNVVGKQLTDASVIAPTVNLHFQQTLLAANNKMKPLPDILRTVDRLQKASQPTGSETAQAIAILTVVGQDISVVIAGVPVSDSTKVLIELIRSAQQTVQTVLIEVGKIQGRE